MIRLVPRRPRRRMCRVVRVGRIGIGGCEPIRIQSMTTTDSLDTEATVRQAEGLAGAGCELVRITAPSVRAALNLGAIRRELRARGCEVPLVADIHFLPAAAMEAARHVEKVRVNPGNYADRKHFAVREYSDAEYRGELARLEGALAPLIERCRQEARALRIGVNHGSLCDRILNRFGDTPLGMVESALEFVRISRGRQYDDVVLSLKASDPKVMIAACRMMAARLDELGWDYPLHLGVTEAGDGEDGRIKSAIGIGALLEDGLGDTVRVSLTEDPLAELPVARRLCALYEGMGAAGGVAPFFPEGYGLHAGGGYAYGRRPARVLDLRGLRLGGREPIRVALGLPAEPAAVLAAARLGLRRETPLELLIGPPSAVGAAPDREVPRLPILSLREWLLAPAAAGGLAAVAVALDELAYLQGLLAGRGRAAGRPALFTVCSEASRDELIVPAFRMLAAGLDAAAAELGVESWPIWIRDVWGDAPADAETALLRAAARLGSLLCDGIGDAVTVAGVMDPARSLGLAYDILQGTALRTFRASYVACPSCGRTQFDLVATTARIRALTSHLTGVKIAIMGCIVNGPGEMADADFGYVGSGPGRVQLYVGRECVARSVPAAEAESRLLDLIRAHGRWRPPPPPGA